jgi:polar amino acid transport system ATP-binding protein
MKQEDTMNPIVNPVVELKDVHKRFGSNQVLKGVSFAIPKGQVVAIIGKSGSGKSTALRCIDRLEIIDSGSIQVCGHAVHSPDVDLRQLRQDVGIVFQSYNLFPHLTVEQNITLAPRAVKNLPAAQARAIATRTLEQVAWPTRRRPTPSSCPAASSSVWRSPARWPWSPR